MRRINFLLLLAAMIALFSCDNEKQPNNPPLSEEDKIVNELMAQCQDFNAEDIMRDLPGEWKRDSYIIYSDEWDKDFEALLLNGDSGASAGLATASFTFTADGTGQICTINYSSLGTENISIRNFEWRYDIESRNLIVSGESVNPQYKVSGFNRGYLVLDYTEHLYDKHTDKHIYSNIREIYKRKAE